MSISLSCVLVGAGCAATWPCRGCSAAPRLFVCLFVCFLSFFLVCLSAPGFGGCSGSEFRGKDRTKRFRRARSTKSEREVGSDSLILSVWATLLCWGAKPSRVGTCTSGHKFLRIYYFLRKSDHVLLHFRHKKRPYLPEILTSGRR